MTDTKETGVPKYPDPKPKAPRVPRSYDSILAGALSLPLIDRAQLRDELIKSVTQEKELLRAKADEVKDL